MVIPTLYENDSSNQVLVKQVIQSKMKRIAEMNKDNYLMNQNVFGQPSTTSQYNDDSEEEEEEEEYRRSKRKKKNTTSSSSSTKQSTKFIKRKPIEYIKEFIDVSNDYFDAICQPTTTVHRTFCKLCGFCTSYSCSTCSERICYSCYTLHKEEQCEKLNLY